jgi:hypothetical protein
MTNPTTTDWRALCAELFAIVEDEYSGTSCLTELRSRTATALAQPEPKMVYRYSPVTIAECGGPCEQGPQYCDCGEIKGELEPQPEPQGPTDEELLELSAHHGVSYTMSSGEVVYPMQQSCDMRDDVLSFARAVLARWGRPAIEPVPTSERPWKREGWCDAKGRCYGWDGDYWWMVGNPGWANETITHWLPHWALPVPQQTP